jgi:DNA-binding response OmpR family regulator
VTPFEILVVEDEQPLRETYARWLEEEGHRTRSVESGEAALTAIEAQVPDLVLLDLGLAGALDGLEVLRRVRQISDQIRVVILTARSGEEAQVRGLDLGADDYILKRTPQRVLLARLNAQLRHVVRLGQRYRIGQAYVDFDARVLIRDGIQYSLTDLEARLLQRLIESPTEQRTSRELLLTVWRWKEVPRYDPEFDLPISGILARLNKKLGPGLIRMHTADRGSAVVLTKSQVRPWPAHEEPPTYQRVVRRGRPEGG